MAVELITPIIIVVGAFILAQILAFLLDKLAGFASKTETNLDDEIIRYLERPLKLIVILTGVYYAIRYAAPAMTINGISINQIFVVIAILVGAYVLVRTVKAILNWYVEEISHKTKAVIDDTIFRFVNKISALIIYAIAILVVLDKLGIEIGPMLAGLGLVGLAIALALQDTLSNFFSAVYIAADRPVKLGDYIKLESGQEGYVEDIGWRSTRIRTLPNNIIIVPNSKLSQSILTNYNNPAPEMSVIVQVAVSYGSDLKKVEKVTLDVAKQCQKTIDGAIDDFEPFVRYHTFGNSSINFSVILRAKTFVDKYMLAHEFVKALKERYNKENIEIPFPQRDVHMKKE